MTRWVGDDGRPIAVVVRPMRLPGDRSLTDLWPTLTPRQKLAWTALVELERPPRQHRRGGRPRTTDGPVPPWPNAELAAAWRRYKAWADTGRPADRTPSPEVREAYLAVERTRRAAARARRPRLAARRGV